MVRPLLDEQNLATSSGGWRGTIRPPSLDGWFGSYRKVLTPYLQAAGGAKADEFVLASELTSLQKHHDQWKTLAVAAARSMLSIPTPARPTTISSSAASSTSAVTLVAERTINAWKPLTASSSSSGDRPTRSTTSCPAALSAALADGASGSVIRTRATHHCRD